MSFAKILLPFVILTFNSCISVISPQTADTLEPGQMSAYAAITTIAPYSQSSKKSSSDDSDDSDSKNDTEIMDAFWIDVGTRYGISSNLDFGIEKTNLLTRFDIKRRIVGNGKGFSMAVGAGVGANNLSGFLNSKKSLYFIRTSDIPIHFSTRVGKSSSLYSVLRYHYTQIQSKYGGIIANSSGSSSSDTTLGDQQTSFSARNASLSFGGVFGEPAGFFVEIAMIKGMDKTNDASRPQIALGVSLLNSRASRSNEGSFNSSLDSEMPSPSPARTKPSRKSKPAPEY